MDKIFTAEELAARYEGITVNAVRLWRYRRTGPRFFRVGKRVFYREEDVIEWEKAQVAAETAKAS